jgi:hypothetical protein
MARRGKKKFHNMLLEGQTLKAMRRSHGLRLVAVEGAENALFISTRRLRSDRQHRGATATVGQHVHAAGFRCLLQPVAGYAQFGF